MDDVCFLLYFTEKIHEKITKPTIKKNFYPLGSKVKKESPTGL